MGSVTIYCLISKYLVILFVISSLLISSLIFVWSKNLISVRQNSEACLMPPQVSFSKYSVCS